MQQFTRLQNALNEARSALSLPQITVPDDLNNVDEGTNAPEQESNEEGLHSMEGHMAPDTLASAPITSLYEVMRPNDAHEGDEPRFSGLVMEPDFITRNVISMAEAEQLTNSYLSRLDHFFYGHSQKYTDLAEIRRTSTLLAVTLCTVASLHDPLGSEAYDKLSGELRNLTSSLMFRQRLGLEDIKALCMASYWLGDMTWIISALVIRKAVSMQYHVSHINQPQTDKEGFCRSQMWLLVYLVNEQVSLLRGAPSSSVDRDFVNWQTHLASPFASEGDLRLVSHIDLLLLLSRIRQTYGIDTMKPIPPSSISQLRGFLDQLNIYGHTWTGKLARNKWLGNFPSMAVQIHWRFAKFFLCSHAFRGLNVENSSIALHPDLEDIAASAISTAVSILEMLIESDELRANLVGVPHYFHTMFAFAAVFLLKVAARYRQHVNVDLGVVFTTSRRVLEVFGHCPCARQHLVHRIARGLKMMIERYEAEITSEVNGRSEAPAVGTTNSNNKVLGEQVPASAVSIDMAQDFVPAQDAVQWLDLENFDFLSMSPPSWNTNFGI